MPLILLNLEQSIDGKWIKEQNLDSLETLKNCGFKVRQTLCYNLFLKESCHLDDDLKFVEVVQYFGNYFPVFLKKIACLRLTWGKL